MGAICNLLEAKVSSRSTTSSPAQWFVDWISGGEGSSAGVKVTERSALKYTPFWAAVRVISGTVGSLPFMVYKRGADDSKERISTHPVYKLLHDRPNEYIDPVTFIESRQAHALCYGNGYAEIQRDGAGRPIALWPLLPDRTSRKIDAAGVPYYEVRMPAGEAVQLADYNVLHIKGLGFDGYTGYNVVAYHKEAIGYGVAVKEYGARFFSGDGSPSGVLEHPNNLTTDAADRLKASWQASHLGLSRSHRIQVLEEGMKWNKTGVDPGQAQALEVQRYTVDDCSRIFNIPPHKIGSLEYATYTNIEEQNIDFISSTMLYWFKKWEQEINYKLFTPSQRPSLFCEILIDALLRGSAEVRSKSYATGRQWGYLSINDIRRMENMNPIGPDGDKYLDPLNMKPAGAAGPDAAPNGGGDSKSARATHYALVESQWRRITTKIAATAGKSRKADFWPRQRRHAETIMYEPVNAYASLCGVGCEAVRSILGGVIAEYINPQAAGGADDSVTLTDVTLERIRQANE